MTKENSNNSKGTSMTVPYIVIFLCLVTYSFSGPPILYLLYGSIPYIIKKLK